MNSFWFGDWTLYWAHVIEWFQSWSWWVSMWVLTTYIRVLNLALFKVFQTHLENESSAFILTPYDSQSNQASGTLCIIVSMIDIHSCIIWLKSLNVHSVYMQHNIIFEMFDNVYIGWILTDYCHIWKYVILKKYFELGAFIV